MANEGLGFQTPTANVGMLVVTVSGWGVDPTDTTQPPETNSSPLKVMDVMVIGREAFPF